MNGVPKVDRDAVTPPSIYSNRRSFIRAGVAVGTALGTAAAYRWYNPISRLKTNQASELAIAREGLTAEELLSRGWRVNEESTSERSVLNYNNFYEFTTQKEAVAAASANFKTDNWTLTIDGMVQKPRTFTIDELHNLISPQERIYRMRCVEAWSMVIPWAGVPLSQLIDLVEPISTAKYVAFETLFDPTRMPGQRTSVLEWPYIEGLRLDEAMNPLTLLATGMYGKALPPQDGAPIRLVVPWKYGFKGIKSIVKMTFLVEQPATSWSRFAPSEYGFYANVNPNVDHPRWSQADEQRIGESGRRKTLMFNGYEEQVADLYSSMDLGKFF